MKLSSVLPVLSRSGLKFPLKLDKPMRICYTIYMKFTILLSILFDLLAKRKVTAAYLSDKHKISPRTVYRYIDILSLSVPVRIKRGRSGGIYIADNYKLPMGFMTLEEYDAAVEALVAAYTRFPEERFLAAHSKLSAQMKTEHRSLVLSGEIGNIIIDGGAFGDTRSFLDKFRLFEDCIRNLTLAEIEYSARTGEKTTRKIEPHVLVFKQNIWYLYAFCHKQRAFRLFHLGRIASAVKTEETFRKRPFKREDIPLNYGVTDKTVEACFEIDERAFADAQDWLGVENITAVSGKWIAEALLPDEDAIVKKIIGLGAGIKVLSPASLKERVVQAAEDILERYR